MRTASGAFYKQLGTGAMDTLRIFFWKSPLTARGLSFRQRLRFLEVGFFYLSSIRRTA